MIANYHTHTYRCKHADGTDEEYIEAAIKAGFEEVGMTDHSPWILHPFEHGMIRMYISELESYVEKMRLLKKKYENQIKVYVGLEAEYFEDRMQWLEEIIQKYELDYLVFGNHYYQYETYDRYFGSYTDSELLLEHYLDHAVKGMRTGLYKIFAHPDIFMLAYPKWDEKCEEVARRICGVAKEENVLLEYNLGGARRQKFRKGGYPDINFWKVVAKYGCPSVIGIDAHSPENLLDSKTIAEAEDLMEHLGVNLKHRIQFEEGL